MSSEKLYRSYCLPLEEGKNRVVRLGKDNRKTSTVLGLQVSVAAG